MAFDRRSSGQARVPFVQRCRLDRPGLADATAFLVNINVLGAYVTLEDLGTRAEAAAPGPLPEVGEPVALRFRPPGRREEIRARGVVSWTNPRQQHPVHSLPPGFGLRFEHLEAAARRAIEVLVEGYVRRNPQAGG